MEFQTITGKLKAFWRLMRQRLKFKQRKRSQKMKMTGEKFLILEYNPLLCLSGLHLIQANARFKTLDV